MDRCSHCQNEVTAGFDFCHQCGASTRAPEDPRDSKIQQVVDVVDQIKGIGGHVSETGASAKQVLDQYLGSPISIQRQITYALVTALAIILSVGSNPFTGKPLDWFEAWLLLAIFFLPIIHYQITGLLPFANIVNMILGDLQSLRRRVLLAFFWTIGPGVIVLVIGSMLLAVLTDTFPGLKKELSSEVITLAGETSLSEATITVLSFLATFLGSFLINFFLMGMATYWRQIDELGEYSLGSRLVEEVDRAADLIRSRIHQCAIRDLSISVIEMKVLRRHTAGEASGTRGQQLVITRGRARIVIFVQNFGTGLFVRWSCYYDASGRRLWILYGMLVDGFNRLFLRWTGTNLIEVWQSVVDLLAPVSAGRDAIDYNRNSLFSQLLRLPEAVSEYSWNDIYALESSVRDVVDKVLEEMTASHQEAEIIKSRNEVQSQLEASARSAGQQASAPSSPSMGGFRP